MQQYMTSPCSTVTERREIDHRKPLVHMQTVSGGPMGLQAN